MAKHAKTTERQNRRSALFFVALMLMGFVTMFVSAQPAAAAPLQVQIHYTNPPAPEVQGDCHKDANPSGRGGPHSLCADSLSDHLSVDETQCKISTDLFTQSDLHNDSGKARLWLTGDVEGDSGDVVIPDDHNRHFSFEADFGALSGSHTLEAHWHAWAPQPAGDVRNETVPVTLNCGLPTATSTPTDAATETPTITPTTGTTVTPTTGTTVTPTTGTTVTPTAGTTVTPTSTPVSTPGIKHNNPEGETTRVPTCYGRDIGLLKAKDVDQVLELELTDASQNQSFTLFNPPYWDGSEAHNQTNSVFVPGWITRNNLKARMLVRYHPIEGQGQSVDQWFPLEDVPALTDQELAGLDCQRKDLDCLTGLYYYFKAPNVKYDEVDLIRHYMADSHIEASIFRGNYEQFLKGDKNAGSFKNVVLPYTGMTGDGQWFAYSSNDLSFYNGVGMYKYVGGKLINNRQPGWQWFALTPGEYKRLDCPKTTTVVTPTATVPGEVVRCVPVNGRNVWRKFPADKAPKGLTKEECDKQPTQPPAPTLPPTGGKAPIVGMVVAAPMSNAPRSLPGLGLGLFMIVGGGIGAWRKRQTIFA